MHADFLGFVLLAWRKRWACFTRSVPLGLVTPFFFGTQGRDVGKKWSVLLERAGEAGAPAWTLGPLSFFAILQGLPRVLGCHIPETAWKVFVGVSVPIYFELVYSALPGALVNGVYRASLFFVHPFQRDCCSCCSGRNCMF